MVNARGYLLDAEGNVIDKFGKKMFDRAILSPDGELPKVFRMNLLKSDSTSSLSELMREIEKNQSSEFDEEVKSREVLERQVQRQQMMGGHEGDGDTSVDSMMEDTPANYNIPNQRFDENYEEQYSPIPEEGQGRGQPHRKQRPAPQQMHTDGHSLNAAEMQRVKRKKSKKKKGPKPAMIEYLMPTKREVDMADAYGGNAKGQFRRPGVKYDKERLQNRIKTPANIPGGKAQLEALANTVAGFNARQHKPGESIENLSARNLKPPAVRRNDFLGAHNKSEMNSNDGEHKLNNSLQYVRGAEMLGRKNKDGTRSKSNLPKGKRVNRTGNFNEVDFEKVLGKDIDQFLEDSEWDIESYERGSHYSRGSRRSASQDQRLKAMEKVYMQKVDRVDESLGPNSVGQPKSNTTAPGTVPRKKPAGPREFQDRFVNDAGYIHRGNATEFETDNQAKRSNSKSPQRQQPLRQSIPNEVRLIKQQSSTSLKK